MLNINQQPHIEPTFRTYITPSIPTVHDGYVHLSDWDVVMFKSYTPILLFYTNPGNISDFMNTEKLTGSLADILVDFYPLAGRLVDIGQGRDAIDCNDTGILYQEANYHRTLEEFRTHGYLANQMDYHRMFPIHFYTKYHDPLVAIQVTRFKDGGVAMGIMFLHKIADKYSQCLFLEAWSKKARGLAYHVATFDRQLVTVPPNVAVTDEVLDYYRDEHRTTTKDHVAASIAANYGKMVDQDQPKYARTSPNGPIPLKSVILEFYSDGLHQCKRDAHTADMIKNKIWLSTKDALFAMLLRAIVRSRDLEPDQAVKMVMGINGRSKMRGLDLYFGNWMVTRAVSLTKQEASETRLVDTAIAFRQKMASLDASLFHGISKLYTIHQDMTVHYLCYQPNSSIRLTTSDASMLPYWRLDFGFGKPDRVRGYITAGGNGCLVLFGRNDQNKGAMFDVQLQMDTESMRRFVNDPDITKYTHRILC
ncbi:transferase [Phascolomyces articulosus]|uniref:Transferase n=1 Tax=Phascolomyces articulosus TaxID=60185 RepID=A0AAD5PAK9_9FUNG|nr:transferase [Phascolomyces articulosus]